MRGFRSVRRPLLLAALVLVTAFAWRTWAATHGSGPPATSLAGGDRESAVIGVALNGQSRAYPLQSLGAEVLDDELGGQPIVVTF